MEAVLLEQIQKILSRFEEIQIRLSLPQVMADVDVYRDLMKEHSRLEPIASAYHAYCRAQSDFDDALVMVEQAEDEETRAFFAKEKRNSAQMMEQAIDCMRELLRPRDPDDEKNVMIEIRAAAGGEEAALFASDLYRMYTMYADAKGLRTSVISANPTELGGYRVVSFSVEGDCAFSHFRFESGVHRVQRVPKTEAQGRIQTSTVTVAVLPEVQEVEVNILPSDITIESMKSSGAGGQHINKTESAVRLTHKPSGIVIECDGERSQFKNRETAMKMLRARLYEMGRAAREEEISSNRRQQVGTGDRSERIRTYNFPQSRVTDHRIGFVSHSLDSMLDGNLSDLIRALRDDYTARLTQEKE